MVIEAAASYLLDPQAQVEDAVGAVGLAVGTSHLLDEPRQCEGELSRVALEDVFFDGHWWDGRYVAGREKMQSS